MLIEGHHIESSLDRAHLWAELVALENISEWSALDECVSADSPNFEMASSYVCTHHAGLHGVDATVEVEELKEAERLVLRTETMVAELLETLELTDHLEGSLLTYSVDATSGSFGPSATLWLRHHVEFVCERLEEFANRPAR